MLTFGYGEASFENLINRGDYYCDKTYFLPELEKHQKFFFIRPRRFGKSLWVSVLEYYYDVHHRDKFNKLFQELYIGKNPSQYKNSYLILRFDFSGINTETEESLRLAITRMVLTKVESFGYKYKDYFDKYRYETFTQRLKETNLEPSHLIRLVIELAKNLTQKVYVLIDEYDHYINNLISLGLEEFAKRLLTRSGYIRTFFEALKTGNAEGVFERFFITGVSPLMLDELSSGFNVMTDMTKEQTFSEMMGFTEKEVRDLLLKLPKDCFQKKNIDIVYQDMVHLYNGYKFTEEGKTRIFNSDMVIYFAEKLYYNKTYPRDLLDYNVKTDYTKMRGLIIGVSGKELLQKIIEELVINTKIKVFFINRFTFEKRFEEHELKSLLFFLGLLTFSDDDSYLEIPNQMIRILFWEYFKKFLEEEKQIKFDIGTLFDAV